ncbi:hypothetical protein PR048_023842 [Dryococelus australis]|uniref:MADF domain-containing protein n=1 Tax=Dryococelus australis TaxID=614101 RepID=A0ABQ9GVD8_9NEOP|nr:hypothetical protein PR048_023842 [Dryococelus australis]
MLILQVQERPELYDVRQKCYRNNQMREKAWAEIANVFEDDFANENFCKMKWKNLRDVYLREKRNLQKTKNWTFAGNAIITIIIKWKYFDVMGFVGETISNEETFSNIQEDSEMLMEALEHLVAIEEGSDSSVHSNTDDSCSSVSGTRTQKKKPSTVSVPDVQDIIQEVTKCNEDEDSLLCESLALGLEKLPSKIKRETKMKL